jgi:hypothetical protein
LLLFLFVSCVSVKTYNKRLETPVSYEKLRKDVDFAYQKLQKLHPELYLYISKKQLDDKFDSLKTTITKPLKPLEFYKKLAPVIAEVRQGHLRLTSPQKRFTKTEIKKIKNQKGLFGRYNFLIDNDRIFVKDNRDSIPNMNVGTEILKIENTPAKKILDQYKPFITSDGFNTSFQKYGLARAWQLFFTIDRGILDSIQIETKYNDSIQTFYLTREKITKQEKKNEKNEIKQKQKNQKTKDYNSVTKIYNRDLVFKEKDSSVAVMIIRSFSGYKSKRFYKESFAVLKKANTKNLIIDVRNNLGGSLSEITNLYKYLGSEKFLFINDIEITSRTSLLHNHFRQMPLLLKPFEMAVYPVSVIANLIAVKKKNGKFFLRNNNAFTKRKPKENAFHGNLYFLINGSSFSASSIITSKLKSDGRAFLVGEETGGANDGTVAGRYAVKKLPNSKLYFPIGLMLIKPNIQFTNTKKGVVPNKEMIPNL